MGTNTRNPVQQLKDSEDSMRFPKIDEGENPVRTRTPSLSEQIARDVYDVGYTKKRMQIDKAADDAAKNRAEEDAEVAAERAKRTPVKKLAKGGSVRGWGQARGARAAKIV